VDGGQSLLTRPARRSRAQSGRTTRTAANILMNTTTAKQPLHPAKPRTIEHRSAFNTFAFKSTTLGRKVRVKDLTYLSDAKLRALLLEADSLLDHFSQQDGRCEWLIVQVAAFVAAVEGEITARGEHRDLFRRVLAMEIGEEAIAAIEARVQALAAAQAAAEAT
jgi:hypothetical protein